MGATVDLLLVLVVILIVVLVWRGPSVLPQLGAALGKAVKGARETIDRDGPTSSSTSAPTRDDDDTPPA